MINTTCKYLLSIILSFFWISIYNSANAQNSVCDSCEIAKKVKKTYFKSLYVKYYETYKNRIDDIHTNRIKIAAAFITYLDTIQDNGIEDYVIDFKGEILRKLDASQPEKDRFKKMTSPNNKLRLFIDGCKENNIKYNVSDYNDESLKILDDISKEIRTKIEECNTKEIKMENNNDDRNIDDNEVFDESESDKELTSWDITSFLCGVLVGVFAVILFLKNKERKEDSKPSDEANSEKENFTDNETLSNEQTDNKIVEDSVEETETSKDKSEEDQSVNDNKDHQQNNQNPSDEPEVQITKPKVSFFPDPSNDRLFLMVDGEDKISSFSLYKITIDDEATTGKLDFLTHINYQIVFDNLERYIYAACDPQNSHIHGKTMNIKQLSSGVVVIRDNKWYVSEKIKIEFY